MESNTHPERGASGSVGWVDASALVYDAAHALVADIMVHNALALGRKSGLGQIARSILDEDVAVLPVVDEHNIVIGVVTDRALVIKACQVCAPCVLSAEDIMSRDFVTTTPESSADDTVKMMIARRLRCVTVVDASGRLLGRVKLARGPANEIGVEDLQRSVKVLVRGSSFWLHSWPQG